MHENPPIPLQERIPKPPRCYRLPFPIRAGHHQDLLRVSSRTAKAPRVLQQLHGRPSSRRTKLVRSRLLPRRAKASRHRTERQHAPSRRRRRRPRPRRRGIQKELPRSPRPAHSPGSPTRSRASRPRRPRHRAAVPRFLLPATNPRRVSPNRAIPSHPISYAKPPLTILSLSQAPDSTSCTPSSTTGPTPSAEISSDSWSRSWKAGPRC